MNLIETEGIVLKTFALGEADRIVLILTRESGLRRLTVRGARKLKSRFSGSLEPYTIVNLVYQQKDEAELGKLFQVNVLESNFHLAWQLEVQVALAYLTELLIAATPMHEPHEKLYRMLRASLYAINHAQNNLTAVKQIVFYFEVWLLRLSGFLPSFKDCAQCGQSLKDQSIYYQAGTSQFVCGNCASRSRWKETQITPSLRILGKVLSHSPSDFLGTIQFSDDSLIVLQKMTRSLLRKLIDYDPHYWTNEFWASEKQESQNLSSI